MASYALVLKPHLRRDSAFFVSAGAAAVALLSAEGFAAQKYRKTPTGREEERRAREEGAMLYRGAREYFLRPGVLGGLLGIRKLAHCPNPRSPKSHSFTVNTAVIGTVGYYGYINWNLPRWDRRIVSAISVGLLALWSGEGYDSHSSRLYRSDIAAIA